MHLFAPCRLVGTIGAVLVLATASACSGDDDLVETTAPVVAQGGTDSDTAPMTTDVPAANDTTDDAAPSTDEDPQPTPEPEQPSDPPRLTGLPPVELSTEQSGGGDRPLLEWVPVEGVDVYGVYLYAPDESIYWTWQGYETSVFVGGETQLPDSMPGPSVVDGMTWSVVGFDADFLPVAVSDVRPIAP